MAAGLAGLLASPAGARTTFYLNSYEPADQTHSFCAGENMLLSTTPPGCGDSVTAPVVLASGQSYLLLVNGAVSAWGAWPVVHCGTAEPSSAFPSPGRASTPAGDDAQFRFAVPLASGCPALPEKTSLFQVDLGSGWFHPIAISNPSTPSKDYKKLGLQHPYLFKLVGEGVAPQFRFVDYHPSDNSGEFKIVVFG